MEIMNDIWSLATHDADEMQKAIQDYEKEVIWDRMNGNVTDTQLEFIEPLDIPGILTKYPSLKEATVFDTAQADSSNLLVLFNDVPYCLRACGYLSLMNTAVGLNGPGLKRLWQQSASALVEAANRFLKANTNDMLIMRCADKVSAFFSANYQIMPFTDLLDICRMAFSSQSMGKPVFRKGSIDHYTLREEWRFPEIEEVLLDKYRQCVKNPMLGASLMPCVGFSSSNSGFNAATLVTRMEQSGRTFPIGDNIRIRHDHRGGGNTSAITDFSNQAGMIFPRFEEGIENLGRLSQIRISNPGNAFVCACNFAFGRMLPKRLASQAKEDFDLLCGQSEASAYDIYLGITEILNYAEQDGMSDDSITKMEEAIMKLLNPHFCRWTDFDIYGTVAWGNSKS